MKSIYKSLAALCSVGVLALFGACTESIDYTGAETPADAQVFFPSSLPATINASGQATSVDVELSRIKTEEALTVSITGTEASGTYKAPTSASFAAGSATTKIAITYDPEAIGYDDFKDMTLTIGDQATPYGRSTYSFKIGIPSPWTSLGENATYIDNWNGWSYTVELQQNDLDPRLYRLVHPFDKGVAEIEDASAKTTPDEYWQFYILPAGTKVTNSVTTTVDGLVWWSADVKNGYVNANYGPELYVHPYAFSSTAAESFWMHNIVTHWSEDGEPQAIQMAPFVYFDGVGGYNYSQQDGFITVIFPGVVLADYSAELTYKGRFVDIADNNYAIIADTLGADVTSAKIAIARKGSEQAVLNGILDGSIEAIEVTEDGEVQLPCNMNGSMTAIIVTYADGEPQEVGTVSFEFSTGNPLNDLEKGKTIDDYLGNWRVPTESYTGASGYFPAVITKNDASTLLVNGLQPVTGYDDTVWLLYDAETGFLQFPPQQMASSDGFPVFAWPMNTTSGNFTETEALIGGLTSTGELLFVNPNGNVNASDAICYFLIEDNTLYYFTGYWTYLMWSPYTPAATGVASPKVSFDGKPAGIKPYNSVSAPSKPIGGFISKENSVLDTNVKLSK
ncbi:MAG: hypothetical protein LBM06_06715 [Prevotellaceae bacterium]|jgi:hypothetical protein|nr:hypothetical protein [Prevotellaceae bacterium]